MKGIKSKSRWLFSLIITVSVFTLTLAFASSKVQASICTWNGTVDASWTTPGNWSNCGGHVPWATDTVTIPSGTPYSPKLNAGSTIDSLTVENNAHLIIENPSVYNMVLTVNNTTTNQGMIELTNTSTNGQTHLVVNNGNFVNTGTFLVDSIGTNPQVLRAQIMNTGVFSVSGHLAIDQNSVNHVNAGMIYIDDGDLEIIQTGASSSFANENGGEIFISTGKQLNVAGGTLLSAGGVFSGTGFLTLDSATLAGAETFVNPPGLTLNLNFATVEADFNNNGSLRAINDSVISSTLLSNLAGASLVISGGIGSNVDLQIVNGFTNFGHIEQTTTAVNADANLHVISGTLVNQGTMLVSGLGGKSQLLAAQLDNQGVFSVTQPLILARESAQHTNNGSIFIDSELIVEQTGTNPRFTNSSNGFIDITDGFSKTLLISELTNRGVVRKTQSFSVTGVTNFGVTGVEMDVISMGTLAVAQVDWVGVNHPQAKIGTMTGAYWDIKPTGSGYDLDLILPHTLSDQSDAAVCQLIGNDWDCAREVATVSTVLREGVTNLSSIWAVGDTSTPFNAFIPIIVRNFSSQP